MIKRVISLLLLSAAAILLPAAIFAVPRWTAAHETDARNAALANQERTAHIAALPPCPQPGPELDGFLEQRQSVPPGQPPSLWIPVCRVTEAPPTQVTVVSSDRQSWSTCLERRRIPYATGFDCALDEPLRFLASPGDRRTWARIKAGDRETPSIWISGAPLAWNEKLVAEHRSRLSFWLALLSSLWVVWNSSSRVRLSLAAHRVEKRAGSPDVPAHAEFVLHCLLGGHFTSLPGDLGEEYLSKRGSGARKSEADRWYCQQVFLSVAPLLASRLEALAERISGRRI
jgi:hypothetical protein